ncbi:hypothetical protein K4K56_012296 [Colletotrichum sp. SAR 10_98]|nr:hypothetical protein K4K56_012296 [Colletotrichum sp. SAR 10_98]
MYLRRLFHILWLATAVTAKWVVPGARWHDTDGNIFNAHAGGLAVEQETGKFYWFGEYKVEGQVEGGGISMWWHVDDSKYSLLLQGLATSDSIAGPYTFQKAISPLGNWSQDFGAFTDYKTGESYALYSNGDRPEGRDVYVSKFNRNLTDVEEVTFRFDKYDFEAPTILQTEKSYFALMSHKTGYRPNKLTKKQGVVAMRADKLEGPWSQPFFVAPAYTRTFSTQSGFSWRIKGSKATTYLYMADQWDMLSLWESRNTFGSHNVIATGIYGNDSTITFDVEGQGRDQWVSFYHQNIDDMGFGDQPFGQPDRINGTWQLRRISSVVVNGDESSVHTLYQKDTHKGIILSTPLLLPLQKGRNTIAVGGLYNGFDHKGADLDRIVVYPPEEKWQKRSFLDALNLWQ